MTFREGLDYLGQQLPGYLNRKQDERQMDLQSMLALHAQRMQEQQNKQRQGEYKTDNARADAALGLQRENIAADNARADAAIAGQTGERTYQHNRDASTDKRLAGRDKVTDTNAAARLRVDQRREDRLANPDPPQPRNVQIPRHLTFGYTPPGYGSQPVDTDVRGYLNRLKAAGVSREAAQRYAEQQGLDLTSP